MASRPPRFQRTLARQVAPSNPDAGAPASALASELSAFSDRQAADRDQRAAEEGFQAGQQAGEFGDDDESIRGRAFNRGAMLSKQAAVQTEIRDRIKQLETEHPNDPDTFNAAVEGMVEGMLEQTDPRVQPFVRQRAADYGGAAAQRIIRTQQAELEKQAIEDLSRGLEGLVDDATTAAFEGNVPLTEARRQELGVLLEEGVAGGMIDEGAAEDLAKQFETAVTQQEILGNFDRQLREKGPDAGVDMIQRWQNTKPSSVDMTAEEHEAVTRQMITRKNREDALLSDQIAKQNAAARAERAVRSERVNDAISVLRDGFTPEPEHTNQVVKDLQELAASEDPADVELAQELTEKFDIANAIQGQVHRFRRMPASQRAQELNELEASLREGGARPEELELLKALQSTNTSIQAQLDTDPRGYLQREGLLEDQPLDYSNVENLVASIDARATDVGTQLTGEPVGRLTAAEADQFAQIYESAEIEERVALLGVLTAGAGDDAEATLNQLDVKGHDQMALMGGFVMEGRGALAREIMRGQAQLANDPGLKPKRTDYQPNVEDEWGAAMGDWPKQRATMLEAAFSKYADLKAAKGDLSDVFDPKLFDQALNAVMPTARFNGRRVAMPAGATEDAFEDWVDSWDASTFEGVPGIEGEEMLELVRDDGRLVEVGNGRYGVAVKSAATGLDRFLVKEDGAPFVMQFPRAAR